MQANYLKMMIIINKKKLKEKHDRHTKPQLQKSTKYMFYLLFCFCKLLGIRKLKGRRLNLYNDV